jgi:Cdc6-like AAA superfamily ATPase
MARELKCQESNYSPGTEGRRGSWKANSAIRHWTRRSNPTDREGLTNRLGRAIPGWAADRKLLFLGPTGSGKTRIVVAAAESLLQNSRAVMKIDCAEFQHSHEIVRLIESHLKRAIERVLVRPVAGRTA